ncbi:Ldh family oxidoreductase [Glutamicibacter sp.]|uniref:Ldh family oxidoreductase n=1 Tax=Glutamicibacter sp. TaxID=1931995 RepID=UPI002FE1C432
MTEPLTPQKTNTFSSLDLSQFIAQCMSAVGANEINAHYMADQLVSSERAGHPSHGLRRLPEYVGRALEGVSDPSAQATIEKDAGALVAMDAHRTCGHFALRDAMTLAIKRAEEHGISAVSVRDSDFAGRLAPFCEQAAEAGKVSLIFGNNNGSLQTVLPPGGLEPKLSTNPLAAGVPRAQAPHMVLDFATSVVASGRLHEEQDSGAQVPKEWVGAGGHHKPFGGFKGFGLSLLVEALGGALSGSDTVSARKSTEAQGTLIIVIDVATMRDLNDYTAQVEEFINYVKDTEVEEGAKPVRAPGENAPTQAQLAEEALISLNDKTWANLQEMAARINVELPARQ